MTVRRVLVAVAVLVVAAGVAAVLVLREPAPPPAARAAQPQGTVLLVPGYGGGTAELAGLARTLRAAGVSTEFLDVGDGQGDLRGYADRLVARARQLQAAGGVAPDVIGFSAGGLTARLAAGQDPDVFRKVITLASPHAGTSAAEFGALFGQCPQACQQMRPGSELLTGLAPVTFPADWLSVWSDTDSVITPADSSVVEGVVDYRLQQFCGGTVEHGQVPMHPQTRAAVVAFLAGSPLPADCVA